MIRISSIIIFTLIFQAIQISGQKIDTIDRQDLMKIISLDDSDTTYVVNFWATWCSPCVKEIGLFEELHQTYKSQKLKVILVSLDFPNQLEKRVLPFLKEKEITADVRLMTDLDYNNWINKVDPSWSGAIPATLIYNKKSKQFFEKEFTKDELFDIVKQIHN
jgi:thiol-disulfide isomerase/thioredoxin